MKQSPIFLLVVCLGFLASVPQFAQSAIVSPTNLQTGLASATYQELAAARRATAKYHDVAQAEADGYINIDLYLSGEGYHYVNFSLVDGNFSPDRPQVLLYAPNSDGTLRLVGVEYLVPLSASASAPAGFTGDEDQWRHDTEGFGFWELNAWIWMYNPEGIFAHDNELIP